MMPFPVDASRDDLSTGVRYRMGSLAARAVPLDVCTQLQACGDERQQAKIRHKCKGTPAER